LTTYNLLHVFVMIFVLLLDVYLWFICAMLSVSGIVVQLSLKLMKATTTSEYHSSNKRVTHYNVSNCLTHVTDVLPSFLHVSTTTSCQLNTHCHLAKWQCVLSSAAANELSRFTGDRCITSCAHLNDVSSQTSERLDHTWNESQTDRCPFNGLFSRTTWVSRHQKG